MTQIGAMFPTGGPVPPELIIGRERVIEDLSLRAREGIHVIITGPRRIGKTTVCRAACAVAAREGAHVIPIEVPERVDSRDLLQMMIDRCASVSLRDEGRKAFRAVRPMIEGLLRQGEIPLDLSELGQGPGPMTARTVLALPRAIAAETGGRVVLFLDELQRIVSYADGEQILSYLLDIYGGAGDVSLIVDGSDERAVQGLLGNPGHIGKLCEPYALAARIDASTWRAPLIARFSTVGLTIGEDDLTDLLVFGDGRPYETMLACRHTALIVRRMDAGADRVTAFEVRAGIDAAVAQLRADDA